MHASCWAVVIYSQWATHVSILVTASNKFLVTEIFCSQKHLPGVLKRNFFLFKNVPGVLKRMQQEGGGFWGVWGAPRPHPGVARGRKTIHFFL